MEEIHESPRRLSVLDEDDDIFSYRSNKESSSSSVSREKSDLLERSTNLLDKIRSRNTSRQTTGSSRITRSVVTNGHNDFDYGLEPKIGDNKNGVENTENDESESGLTFMRKKIEVRDFEFSKPDYKPSSNLELARERIRNRQSAVSERPTASRSNNSSSRSSRLSGIRTPYSSRMETKSDNDVLDSYIDKPQGRLSAVGQLTRSRFARDSPVTIDSESKTIINREETSAYDTDSRNSRFSSDTLSENNVEMYIPLNEKPLTESINLKAETINDVSGFLSQDSHAEPINNDCNQMSIIHNHNDSSYKTVETMDAQKPKSTNDILRNVQPGTVENKYDSSDSSEEIETTEEVVYIVQQDGEMTLLKEQDTKTDFKEYIYNDMPLLEDDVSLENIRNTTNSLPEKNIVSHSQYDRDYDLVRSEHASQNTYDRVNSNRAPKTTASSGAERVNEIRQRMAEIKKNLQLENESSKEGELLLESIKEEQARKNIDAQNVRNKSDINTQDLPHTSTSPNIPSSEKRKFESNKLSSKQREFNDTFVNDNKTLETVRKSTVNRRLSANDDCIEFVKNTQESDVIVFTHPFGDKAKSATLPRAKSTKDGQTTKPKTAPKPVKTAKPNVTQKPSKHLARQTEQVMIIPKSDTVVIPSVFKGNSSEKGPSSSPNKVTKSESPEKLTIKKNDSVKSVLEVNQNANNSKCELSENDVTIGELIERGDKSPKKIRPPSVKNAITNWEHRRNSSKSMSDVTNSEEMTNTKQSWFDRLSKPKQRSETPAFERQQSGRKTPTFRKTNNSAGGSSNIARRLSTPNFAVSNPSLASNNADSDSDSVKSSKSMFGKSSTLSKSLKSPKISPPNSNKSQKRQQKSTEEYLFGTKLDDDKGDATSNTQKKIKNSFSKKKVGDKDDLKNSKMPNFTTNSSWSKKPTYMGMTESSLGKKQKSNTNEENTDASATTTTPRRKSQPFVSPVEKKTIASLFLRRKSLPMSDRKKAKGVTPVDADMSKTPTTHKQNKSLDRSSDKQPKKTKSSADNCGKTVGSQAENSLGYKQDELNFESSDLQGTETYDDLNQNSVTGFRLLVTELVVLDFVSNMADENLKLDCKRHSNDDICNDFISNSNLYNICLKYTRYANKKTDE